MDIHLRRRAILTGLRPFLRDDELQAALRLWQQAYASQPVFALSGLVAQCCTRPELKQQRKQILRALIAAMELTEAELLPDTDGLPGLDPGAVLGAAMPAPGETGSVSAQQAGGRDSAPFKLPGPDTHTRSFMQLMEAMMANCAPGIEAVMRQRLQAGLEPLALPPQQRQALWSWLSGQARDGLPGYAYDLSAMQALVNQAYILMCEHMGPVKADQALSRAVQATQATMGSASVHALL